MVFSLGEGVFGQAWLSSPEGLCGFAEHLFAGEADVAELPSIPGQFAQRSPLAATEDPGADRIEARV